MKKIILVLILLFSFQSWSVFAEEISLKIGIYFSPEDNCDKQVIQRISDAKEKLDIMIYSLTKDEIAQAIINVYQKGVRVRVIVDKQQAGLKSADDEKLEEAGIALIRDTHSGLMHNKVAIIDEKIVLTGSYNWTKGGTKRNDENLVIIEDERVAQIFGKKFEQLWTDMGGLKQKR